MVMIELLRFEVSKIFNIGGDDSSATRAGGTRESTQAFENA